MQNAEQGTAIDLDGRDLAIGIVQARFNESITNALAAWSSWWTKKTAKTKVT